MQERSLKGLDSLPEAVRGCVLTIGNFDGVHVGHQRILRRARDVATAENLPVVALTFDPPPEVALGLVTAPQTLTPAEVKCRLLLEAGADWVVTASADRAMLELTADDFVRGLLLPLFAPRHIVEGQDFLYGRQRGGNVSTLIAEGIEAGFVVHVVDPVMLRVGGDDVRVSSTFIRRLLLEGRVEDARHCLGRPFAMRGEIVKGDGRGRALEFPTANLNASGLICPGDGVYAGAARIEPREYPAAISIGSKPTFAGAERTVEAFLLDASGDLYSRAMELSFLSRLRSQERFPSAEALKAQIARDVERVRELARAPAPSGQKAPSGKTHFDGFDAVAQRLEAAKSILIVTHARPDGDGLGSMAALAAAARAAGKSASLLLPDRLPARYEFLFPQERPAGVERFAELADAADLLVVVDTCAFSQLDGLEEGLRARQSKTVVIDHHATAERVGAAQWLDSSAAAAGVMVCEVLEALGWPAGRDVAENLMIAITFDTGWLHFANTDARCLRAAAKCLEKGLRPDELYRRLYQTDRRERLRLIARMLAGLEFHCGGRLALMTIRKSDFAETGCRPDETENLVNEPLRAGSVESSVLLVENDDVIRVSLRSREAVDVAEIARRFGGGGHVRASGARIARPLEEARRLLVAEFEKAFAALGGDGK
jgi:riboflavin kinase/FMN adenylyltransferase